jgi:hypothetical protein
MALREPWVSSPDGFGAQSLGFQQAREPRVVPFFLGEQEKSKSELKEVLAGLDQLHAKLDALSRERGD